MPIFNLFKNCSYYWGFAAYVAYFVNHPKYTAPPEMLSIVCFGLAVLAQLSNLRCANALIGSIALVEFVSVAVVFRRWSASVYACLQCGCAGTALSPQMRLRNDVRLPPCECLSAWNACRYMCAHVCAHTLM
jgi:hypothetical protein